MILSSPTLLWTPLCLCHVLCQGVLLHMEAEGRSFGADGDLHVRETRFRAVEEQEVRYAERSGHSGIIAEAVFSAFLYFVLQNRTYREDTWRTDLEATRGMRLHNIPHVLDELSHARPDFTATHAYDHASRRAVGWICAGDTLGDGVAIGLIRHLSTSFLALVSHSYGERSVRRLS